MIAAQSTPLAQAWCVLSLLHGRIQAPMERVPQDGHGLHARIFPAACSLRSRTSKAPSSYKAGR